MKNLSMMIETIRKVGIITEFNKQVDTEKFYSIIENCNPFIFKRRNKNPSDVIATDIDELDAPFSTLSIEMDNGFITIPNDQDVVRVYTKCLVINEVQPKKYEFYVFVKATAPGAEDIERIFYIDIYHDTEMRKLCMSMALQYIGRLNTEKRGLEKTRERIKIGTGKGKRTHTVRQVIHVYPKKETIASSPSGREIDWQSRWIVRGHWRVHNGLGKDRAGNYNVQGYTWITEHCKGPDGLPLIKRTRLVENEE
jgi:hypothetical protein